MSVIFFELQKDNKMKKYLYKGQIVTASSKEEAKKIVAAGNFYTNKEIIEMLPKGFVYKNRAFAIPLEQGAKTMYSYTMGSDKYVPVITVWNEGELGFWNSRLEDSIRLSKKKSDSFKEKLLKYAKISLDNYIKNLTKDISDCNKGLQTLKNYQKRIKAM